MEMHPPACDTLNPASLVLASSHCGCLFGEPDKNQCLWADLACCLIQNSCLAGILKNCFLSDKLTKYLSYERVAGMVFQRHFLSGSWIHVWWVQRYPLHWGLKNTHYFAVNYMGGYGREKVCTSEGCPHQLQCITGGDDAHQHLSYSMVHGIPLQLLEVLTMEKDEMEVVWLHKETWELEGSAEGDQLH